MTTVPSPEDGVDDFVAVPDGSKQARCTCCSRGWRGGCFVETSGRYLLVRPSTATPNPASREPCKEQSGTEVLARRLQNKLNVPCCGDFFAHGLLGARLASQVVWIGPKLLGKVWVRAQGCAWTHHVHRKYEMMLTMSVS